MINGQLYVGAQHYAGEVGYYPIGCDWSSLDYTDLQAVTEAVGKLIAMISVVLAPSQVVLYGDFWQVDSAAYISQYAKQMLQHTFSPTIALSEQFEEDFVQGMIQLSLKQLHHN